MSQEVLETRETSTEFHWVNLLNFGDTKKHWKVLRYNKLQGKSFSLEASLFFEFLFSLRLLPESGAGGGDKEG
uniref:Uncharacterized protein n=1 Tax=Vespula pensylvanica TaxID=30213 RepID=A0A834UBW7_VESPE|nr:hypothetical protein H0235_005893 [Vespula pensylvanica]